mgnify:CR=1 FL=1
MEPKVIESPILWDNKRYHSLDYALKRRFGEKVAKLSLDGGFTCPTRDGTKGTRGCIFCSSRGSGDFTKAGNITLQMAEQAALLAQKWKTKRYIAYFQSHTNTYGPIEKLKALFDEALAFPGTVGLAVATRCDCLGTEVLDLLEGYNKKTFLWVELGLQTSSDETGRLIGRGFETQQFDEVVGKLDTRGIRTVAHLIAGLPGEDGQGFLRSVRHVAALPVWGMKLQMLHVLTDSDLYEAYLKAPYRLFDREEYVELISDALELIPPDKVIHRLTGDGSKDKVYAPLWTLDKRRVLTEIQQELTRRRSYQGKFHQG